MNKLITSVIILVIIIILGFILFSGNEAVAPENETPSPGVSASPNITDEPTATPGTSASPTVSAAEADHTVTYNDRGFVPATLTIKAGESVEFVNESSGPMWVASAMHPTHEIYPSTSIENCVKVLSERLGQFDQCDSVSKGGSWTFTFDEVGEWRYHNHRNASDFGAIVVQ